MPTQAPRCIVYVFAEIHISVQHKSVIKMFCLEPDFTNTRYVWPTAANLYSQLLKCARLCALSLEKNVPLQKPGLSLRVLTNWEWRLPGGRWTWLANSSTQAYPPSDEPCRQFKTAVVAGRGNAMAVQPRAIAALMCTCHSSCLPRVHL
jgi:hypothetical protein